MRNIREGIDTCVCCSCGAKWKVSKQYNYDGHEVVTRSYKNKKGEERVEHLFSLLCKKCGKKLQVQGQTSFTEEID